jgi:hypothetical protein
MWREERDRSFAASAKALGQLKLTALQKHCAFFDRRDDDDRQGCSNRQRKRLLRLWTQDYSSADCSHPDSNWHGLVDVLSLVSSTLPSLQLQRSFRYTHKHPVLQALRCKSLPKLRVGLRLPWLDRATAHCLQRVYKNLTT